MKKWQGYKSPTRHGRQNGGVIRRDVYTQYVYTQRTYYTRTTTRIVQFTSAGQ